VDIGRQNRKMLLIIDGKQHGAYKFSLLIYARLHIQNLRNYYSSGGRGWLFLSDLCIFNLWSTLTIQEGVLGNVYFGHKKGQHWSLWLVLIRGSLLIVQGYYHNLGRKPDENRIGKANGCRANVSNTWDLVLTKGRMRVRSMLYSSSVGRVLLSIHKVLVPIVDTCTHNMAGSKPASQSKTET